MPVSHNETLPQRYEREHREYLSLLSKMTPEQIADLERQLHNALAALEAVVEAGRSSDQERAVYCAEIARNALAAAKGGA